MDDLFALSHGIIPACDVHTPDAFEHIIASTCSVAGVVGYKIGCTLALTQGLPALVEIARSHTMLPIIYDHQKAGTDIPLLGRYFARACAEGGVNGVVMFPQSGPGTAAAFVEAIVAEGLVPIVGGEMTHPGYLSSDGGFIEDSAPQRMYEIGMKSGARHFVVPGSKPEKVKDYADLLSGSIDAPVLVMPGIGRQGGDIKTAFAAAGVCSCYAIIGSAIYGAADIRKATAGFCEEALAFE